MIDAKEMILLVRPGLNFNSSNMAVILTSLRDRCVFVRLKRSRLLEPCLHGRLGHGVLLLAHIMLTPQPDMPGT